MEELTEFDDAYKKKQEELLEKQKQFEVTQKRAEELRPVLEKKELKKDRLFSWGVIGLLILFLLFLAYTLIL